MTFKTCQIGLYSVNIKKNNEKVAGKSNEINIQLQTHISLIKRAMLLSGT